MINARIRSRVPEAEIEARSGMLPGEGDYNLLLTGPATLAQPDGRPLCVYLPGALRQQVDAAGVYDVLHELRLRISRNRGKASGSPRYRSNQKRSYTRPIASAIAGAIDPGGQQRYCRLTSWTGTNLPKWQTLHPLLRAVAAHLSEHVPARYHAQAQQAQLTDPAWVVPGTPFTTITVNNSYATGMHTDKGDLDAGFSTITTLRRGDYTGGRLVFPAYRAAVDMGHGDLILMDAHQWHGNTQIICACNKPMNGACETCGAERISMVAYYRTKLVACGSPAEETAKARAWTERSLSDGQ